MADGTVVIEILGDAAKFNATLAKIEKSASKGLGSLGSAAEGLGTALTAGVTAPLAAAAAAAGKWALDTASAAEQADIAFSTMLGPEKAKELIADLSDFAAHTPFEMSGLTSATQKLLAYGFAAEDVIPMLTSVGDATSGLGAGQEGIDAVTRALGQMQAKGKAYAEEMLQLTEVGIPAWQYLADALGTDVAGAQELVTRGAVDAETAISALQAGMDRDFGGMMAEQATTLQGTLSNLTDSAANAVRTLKDTDGWKQAAAAVADLADSIGPLVEKAVPLADEGLQRLAGVVTDVAAAMNSMDGGDVAALADGLIKAAAAGPALLVAGKGLTALSKGMDVASSASEVLSKAFASAAKGAAEGADGASGLAGKLGGLLAKVNPLAAGVAALATVGIAAFVSYASEAQREAETYAAAMDALSSASEVADGSMRDAAGGAEELGGKVYELADGIQENWEGIASLGSAFQEIDTRANAQISSLQSARQAIADYGGQTDLTAQQQGALRAALETVNSQCGTNYEVVRDSGGAYQIMSEGASVAKDSIYELIDAQIAQAKVDAQTEKLEELYSAQADQAQDYAEALGAVREAQERVNELSQAAASSDSPIIAADLADAENDLASLTETAEGYREQMEATGEEVAAVEESIGNLTGAASGAVEGFDALVQGSQGLNALFSETGGDIQDFADDLEATGIPLEQWRTLSEDQLMAVAAAWDGSSESIADALARSGAVLGEFSGIFADASSDLQETGAVVASALGMPLDQFEQKLAEAGVSTETLNEVGSANLMAMAASCGGSLETLTWMLQNYNNVPIVDKNGNVTADTTQLIDAQGQVYTWNGTELLDKSGNAVVYMSDLTEAQRQKLEWNEQGIATLDGAAVVDDSSLTDAQGNAVEWNGTTLKSKDASATIDYSSLQTGIDLLNTWNSMRAQNKSATFTTTNRTVNVTEQSAGRSAAPAAASAFSAAPAPTAAQIMAARLSAAPAAAFRTGSAAAILALSAPRAAEARDSTAAAEAAARAVGGLASEMRSLERRFDDAIGRLGDRMEEAMGGPVELVADKRNLGRLFRDVIR